MTIPERVLEARRRRKYSITVVVGCIIGMIGGGWPVVKATVSWMDDRYMREVEAVDRRIRVADLEGKVDAIDDKIDSFQHSYEVNRLLDQRMDLKSQIIEIERILDGPDATGRDREWYQDLKLRLESINQQLRARGVDVR